MSRRELVMARPYSSLRVMVLLAAWLLGTKVSLAQTESLQRAGELLEKGQVDQAIQVLEGVPAGNAAAQFQSGLLLAHYDQFLAAEKHFQLAHDSYPQAYEVAYDLALAQFRAGKFAKSAATLERLRQSKPHDADLLNLLGEAYLEAGQPQRALDTLKQAIATDPRDERNYIAVAKLSTDENMPAMGLTLLDQGLRVLPDSYRLLLERGDLRLSLQKYSDAEVDYGKANELQPASESPKIGLAVIHIETRRYAAAAAELQQVLSSSPSNLLAHYLLGQLRIREGRDGEALTHLQQAAASGFAPAHSELGKLYLRKNDAGAAIREFETATKLDPDDTTPYYQLSILYGKTGEKEKARQALERLKQINETVRNTGTNRALVQRMRKLQAGDPASR
jgi:tetratricopeptide (TPR) repeat protein